MWIANENANNDDYGDDKYKYNDDDDNNDDANDDYNDNDDHDDDHNYDDEICDESGNKVDISYIIGIKRIIV